jgi:D-alanine--poly(phosphoribitol) ligase subunit 2
MPNMDRIFKVLIKAVDQLNRELRPEQRLTKTPETVVFGRGGRLDSLGLVNFLVLAEQQLQDEFSVPVSLADERAMSQERSPFRTLTSMAEYVAKLLAEKGDATSSQAGESSLPVPARESAGT